MTGTTYEQRMHAERRELQEKLDKLVAFVKSEGFLKLEMFDRYLLSEQARYMRGYLDVLNVRFNRIH